MCESCYREYGSPRVVSQRVKDAAELIRIVYEYSPVGGNCHIVFDDWNIEDSHIDWCLNEAIPENYHKASAYQRLAEEAALSLMRGLSMEERASAMAIHCGFIK